MRILVVHQLRRWACNVIISAGCSWQTSLFVSLQPDADDEEESEPAAESKPVEESDMPETTSTDEKQPETDDNQQQSRPAQEKVKSKGNNGESC